MLTETRFRDLYKLSLELTSEGAYAAAREILFYLFDRGQEAGGYGVVRLTFVLRDLATLADVGQSGERGKDAKCAYEGLVARRDAREEAAVAGTAGFVELQELVALNRSLGQKERSFALFRKLQKDDGNADTAATLGGLLRDELMPRDPHLLVEEILHQRMRDHLYSFVELTAGLAETRAASADGTAPSNRRHDLRKAAGELRAAADRLRRPDEAEKAGGAAPSGARQKPRQGTSQGTSLAGEVWKLTDPRRLAGALDQGEAANQRLESLTEEGRDMVQRYAVEAENKLADDLYERVLGVAAEVAESISELRVQEDFRDSADAERAQKAVQDFTERKVRQDGLLVYEVLLRLGETESAERMAAWLLAYRQDEDMYLQLIQAARRSEQAEVEEELNEEAQRVLVGG